MLHQEAWHGADRNCPAKLRLLTKAAREYAEELIQSRPGASILKSNASLRNTTRRALSAVTHSQEKRLITYAYVWKLFLRETFW